MILSKKSKNEFRPGRKQVASKREENSGLLKWKVDEVRLRDNRPLSMKFNKKRQISPKITQNKIYNVDKVKARMEQIKRELRENMTKDVAEMKSKNQNYNTFTHRQQSKHEENYYTRISSNGASSSQNKYHSHNQQNQRNNYFHQKNGRNTNYSPSPNSRIKIESRKEYLKQTLQNQQKINNKFDQNGAQYCSRESYYSPYAKEFHSRRDESHSPNIRERSRSVNVSPDFSGKKRVLLTPKRKKLFDEFKNSKMM